MVNPFKSFLDHFRFRKSQEDLKEVNPGAQIVLTWKAQAVATSISINPPLKHPLYARAQHSREIWVCLKITLTLVHLFCINTVAKN